MRWTAALLPERYEGVMAWRQEQDYKVGHYGEPRILICIGKLPDLAEIDI
nr:hypothetical protein [Rhodanobacter glycinis]